MRAPHSQYFSTSRVICELGELVSDRNRVYALGISLDIRLIQTSKYARSLTLSSVAQSYTVDTTSGKVFLLMMTMMMMQIQRW